VLENVSGLRKHLGKFHQKLSGLGWYEVLTISLDPMDLGEPVRRRRFYFVLVRVDVAIARGAALDEHVRDLLKIGNRIACVTPAQRLLPNDSTHVVQYEKHRGGMALAAPRGRVRPALGTFVRLSRPVLGLTARAEHVMGTLLHRQGLLDLSAEVNIDTSQSLKFARITPYLPTITPGAQIVVGQLRRVMLPIEKCLANAIPIHEAVWPEGFGERDFADLGGNTMHLMTVAKAMLIGLALVDWRSHRLARPLSRASRPEACPCPPREVGPLE